MRKHPLSTATLALAAAALLATACSASKGSSGANATPTANARDSLVAYSRCMRSHGVPDFPDPDSQGGLTLNGEKGGDLAPDSPAFKAASEACKSLQPRTPDNPNRALIRAGALKYSACMRAHGLPRFPDPGADGGLQIQAGPDLDPNSPQYIAADKACQHFLAKPPPGAPGQDGKQNHIENGHS